MATYNLVKAENNGVQVSPGKAIDFWSVTDTENNQLRLSSVIRKIIVNEEKDQITFFLQDEDRIVGAFSLFKGIINY